MNPTKKRKSPPPPPSHRSQQWNNQRNDRCRNNNQRHTQDRSNYRSYQPRRHQNDNATTYRGQQPFPHHNNHRNDNTPQTSNNTGRNVKRYGVGHRNQTKYETGNDGNYPDTHNQLDRNSPHFRQHKDNNQKNMATNSTIPLKYPAAANIRDTIEQSKNNPTIKHPTKTYEGLMKISNLQHRLETFDRLPETGRVELLLHPYGTQNWPARDRYPDNWDSIVSAAKITVTKQIEMDHAKKGPPQMTHDSEDSEDDDDGYTIYDTNTILAQTQPSGNKKRDLDFVQYLERCLPIMTWGFHADRFNRVTNDNYCFCPCSRTNNQKGAVGRLQKLCNMEERISRNMTCNKKERDGMKSKAFVDHMIAKSNCPLHEIAHRYIQEVYKEYYGPYIRHNAFEKLGDPKDKKAEAFIQKEESKKDKEKAQKLYELEISRNGLHQVSTVNMSTKPILRNELKTPLYLGSTHNRNRRKHER